MKTRKEIEDFVSKKVTLQGLAHISDMLEGIQDYLLFDKLSSKFVELCSNENWIYAEGIADYMNREILKSTTIFKDFVKIVKTSPEYISKKREKKLKEIFE